MKPIKEGKVREIYDNGDSLIIFTFGNGNPPVVYKLTFDQSEITTLSNHNEEDAFDAAVAMVLSPDEHYLFCATAGDNTVSMYKIDEDTGLLEKRFVLPISGEYPKSVVPFPDGRHLAVANNSSNTITTFSVDYEKNLLIMKGRPQTVDRPNCILFREIEG